VPDPVADDRHRARLQAVLSQSPGDAAGSPCPGGGGLLAIGLPYNRMAVSPGLAPLPLPILVAVLSVSLL